MSTVVPFKALRPRKNFIKAVASCPYDVVNLEEARSMVKDNPLSFLHVEKSEIDLPMSPNTSNINAYEIARQNLQKLINEDVIFQEEKKCFYIYRQKMDEHEQYGIVAGISIAEYESGHIRKHELTKADKEADRTSHVQTVNANTGPVFVTYRTFDGIDNIIVRVIRNEPEYDFIADDGIVHTVWIIDREEDITAVIGEFAKVDTLYIADGHHRAAAAAAVAKVKRKNNPSHCGEEEYNYMLAVLIPGNQLRIMAYNRIIRDLHGFSERELIDKIGQKFMVSNSFPEKSPRRFHEFGMYLPGGWYGLRAMDGSYEGNDPIRRLDVAILQDNILGPIIGIEDPRTDERIEYIGAVRGMKELERLVDSGKFAAAFSLFPTTMEQVMDVADAGKVMPPKSTWFEPKLRSGIFVHLLE